MLWIGSYAAGYVVGRIAEGVFLPVAAMPWWERLLWSSLAAIALYTLVLRSSRMMRRPLDSVYGILLSAMLFGVIIGLTIP